MNYIISLLIIILAFSGYKAVTSYHALSNHEETPKVIIPPPVTEMPSGQQQKVIYVYEIEEEDSGSEENLNKEPGETSPNFTSNNSVEQAIINTFGPEARIALAIAKAESGLNPRAVNVNRNGSRDIGVFQINDRHRVSAEERFDWQKNILIAKAIRDRYGWTEWSAYNNGSYKRFL